MFLQAWFLPNTPQIRGGMGRKKSTALFEENLSLICCSCRGAFGQLNRAGFGSFPNEATTCYTWIGHLGGTLGHRGIWLSFPLWSARGKQVGGKKSTFYLSHVLSSAASQYQKVQQHPVRAGEACRMWWNLGFGNESCVIDLLCFEMSLTYFCFSAAIA